MANDLVKMAEVTAAFAIPFIAKFTDLPIFFSDWKNIYMVTASLIASVIYAFIRFTNPNLVFFPIEYWWIILLLGIVLIVGYIAFYTYRKNNQTNGVLITGLCLFIALYICITSTFAMLFQSLDYQVVKCRVREQSNNNPVAGAIIKLYYDDEKNDIQKNEYEIPKKTNKNGMVKTYLRVSIVEKLKFFSVFHDDFQNIQQKKIGPDQLPALMEISMQN